MLECSVPSGNVDQLSAGALEGTAMPGNLLPGCNNNNKYLCSSWHVRMASQTFVQLVTANGAMVGPLNCHFCSVNYGSWSWLPGATQITTDSYIYLHNMLLL